MNKKKSLKIMSPLKMIKKISFYFNLNHFLNLYIECHGKWKILVIVLFAKRLRCLGNTTAKNVRDVF